MTGKFERLAIVNRGEAAMRVIHAVRELRQEATADIVTVALFTDPDRQAMFVREADDAVGLGPALVDDADGRLRSAYLDPAILEQGLRQARADAAWVGWGFAAERTWFAELCDRMGIVFVGPRPEVMRRMGDKIAVKHLAGEVGVEVAPWSGAPVDSVPAAMRAAEKLGYPLMVKAAAGGEGRGIREVRAAGELASAFESARAEARAAFGDPTVFLERRIEGARHVEVQIVGDHHGSLWALGVRDCTIQRGHRKVVEEAPSPVLSGAGDRALREAALRLARAVGYQSAGTVEFLWSPATQRFCLLEVNTRLQLEHPVTEATAGVDLVKLQLHVARGGRLEGAPPESRGHAVEVRITAEDPDRHFAASPGRIERLRVATGPGLRIDTGVAEGDELPAGFEPAVAKVVAHGSDRNEAVARLRRALAETVIAVRGGATDKSFLLAVLDRPEMRRAETDNRWLDEVAARGEHVLREHADVALLQAAVDAYDAEEHLELVQFASSALRGRPAVRREVGISAELRYRGQVYRLGVRRVSAREYRVEVDGVGIDLSIDRLGELERGLRCGGRRYHVLSMAQGLEQLVEVEGVPHRIAHDAGGVVRAPAPAVVLALLAEVGDEVAIGERLAVLEAMKMETPVLAPVGGRVRQVLVSTNVQVDAGAPLLVIEPLERGTELVPAERIRFTRLSNTLGDASRERWRRCRDGLQHLMLGFDIDRGEAQHLLGEWTELTAGLAADDAELLQAEDELLAAFADLHALFRRQGDGGAEEAEPELSSPQEYLLTYLRTIDGRGEGLPNTFLDRLRTGLRHYGVDGLGRGPKLDESLMRIYKARARGDEQANVVLGVLERRLERRSELAAVVGEGFRELLDHLISTARGRFPAVHDIAREVRYRYLDEPLFVRARDAVYARAEAALQALAGEREPGRRAALIAELVDCPQPLVGTFLARLESCDDAVCDRMLEVLTRRYYRIRALEHLTVDRQGGQVWASGEYEHEGRRIHLLSSFATAARLPDAIARLRDLVAAVPEAHDVVADIYVRQSEPGGDAEAVAEGLRAMLEGAGFSHPLRRLVFAVGGGPSAGHRGMGRMQHFTYRAADGGYAEERPLRGLHPMMGKRMNLWRLAHFEIERLPSAEDVYLFHATARENPKDERLFAIAEVRDLTPLRDEVGRQVHLPLLEHMLVEAVSAIRHFQSRRPPAARLQPNRILLYVWPPLRLSPEELDQLVKRLAPLTEGVGLEQVAVRARMPNAQTGALEDALLRISNPGTQGLLVTYGRPPTQPLRPLDEYQQKVVSLQRRGLIYPYELVRMLTPPRDGDRTEIPPGEFLEYDLDEAGVLVPVERPYGQNRAHVVVGLIRSFTPKFPDGMERVILLGDASKEMGSVAEPECRRILAALGLARERRVPLEWFTLSAGAKISMESGTENMDWISRVLRALIEFTQEGGEVNVVVVGINVGAQPYWNAEATMLMHTRGILVMTPEAAMVLTGKQALDYSGSVSAEDNFGIGGYDRIMGPNGQAQYFAGDLAEACGILLRHYDHTYVRPGERWPRRAATDDPRDRDVRTAPHGPGGDEGFARVGDVFSDEKNPGRKKPFEIRRVMAAVIDRDHAPLERWPDMRDAETAVVWDAHLGGIPVCLMGMESRPVRRLGLVPADGPAQWTAGTLFPRSSKKVARAVNSASGNRPLVVLANLSGFDGSPDSMRNLQLEYGAEIGRAVVNFRGPIVFCVVSRYHGGAFVVFSRALNESFEAAALEGTYASVIGGAPAAAVVFAREVETRTRKDPRLALLEKEIAATSGAEDKAKLRLRLAELRAVVHSEKLGEVADEFDHVHSVERALRVGSLDHILPPARLRPYLIEALERGLARAAGSAG